MQTIAPHKMAYFLTWANFDEGNFDQPYVMTNRRGDEMINQFIDFYNSPQSVFAHQAPDLSKVPTKAAAAKDAYGYLTAPDAMERLLGRKTIRAHVAGNFQNAQFVLKKKDGTVAAVIPAGPPPAIRTRRDAAGDGRARMSCSKPSSGLTEQWIALPREELSMHPR